MMRDLDFLLGKYSTFSENISSEVQEIKQKLLQEQQKLVEGQRCDGSLESQSQKVGLEVMSSLSGYLYDQISQLSDFRVAQTNNRKSSLRTREVVTPPYKSVRKLNKIVSAVDPYFGESIQGLSTRDLAQEKAAVKDLELEISIDYPEIPCL